MAEDLAGRVLGLDVQAGSEAGALAAEASTRGRPLEVRDAMVCGVAVARRASVATRNARHLEPAPTAIVNPWDQPHFPAARALSRRPPAGDIMWPMPRAELAAVLLVRPLHS